MTDHHSSLRGQTALVTGAARRLGRAIALGLAAEGANVVVHHNRSVEAAEQTAALVCERGGNAWLVRGDLRDSSEAEAVYTRAVQLVGPIDILINNAAVFTPSTLRELDLDDLSENFQVNAISPLVLARRLAAGERESNIVNLLDTRVVGYDRAHAAYQVSKKILLALTEMMALEFAPHVRVNAVAPGLVLPPPGKDDSYLNRLLHVNPLRRRGSEEEIWQAVRFLLRSPFITGQVIFVDGGQHLKGPEFGVG